MKEIEMLRLAPTVCPFCEIRAFVKGSNPSWRFQRNAATLQKRKPSRMTLSSNVKRRDPRTAAGSKDGEKKDARQYGPFGGMNVTTAPFERRAVSAFRPVDRKEVKGRSSMRERDSLRGRSSMKEGDGLRERSSMRERDGLRGRSSMRERDDFRERSSMRERDGSPGKSSMRERYGTEGRRPAVKEADEPRRDPRARETRRTSPKRKSKDKDPMHALKMQSSLTPVSYEKRNRVKEILKERESFDEFNLLPVIKESIATQGLGGMIDVSPTPIQRLALPALLERHGKKGRRGAEERKEMQQFLLAAETGSGKTLAYVLPVIDAIKRAEAEEGRQQAHESAKEGRDMRRRAASRLFEIEAPPTDEPDPSTARPRAIVLLPTSELVEQVGNVVKNLSHTVKYRSALLSSSYSGKVIRSRLFTTGGIDIVLSTPHLLHSITETDPNILSRVTHLVIDEADSLLDRSFSPTTQAILDRARPSLEQLILCSATVPKSLNNYISKRFPDIRRLVTPNLHAIPRRVQLSVIDIEKIPYHGNRDLACAQVIWDIGKEVAEQGEEREKKVVVFVNEREKTVELAQYLRSKGIDATALSRDADERKQEDVLAIFTGTGAYATSTKQLPAPSNGPKITKHTSDSGPFISAGDLMEAPLPSTVRANSTSSRSRSSSTSPSTNPSSPPRRSLPSTRVLVVTDLASRGIDTLPVRHVILYDVPHTSIDFIHRLGRLGRMGRRGRGVVLVGRNDRKDVVREVREGMFRGSALI